MSAETYGIFILAATIFIPIGIALGFYFSRWLKELTEIELEKE